MAVGTVTAIAAGIGVMVAMPEGRKVPINRAAETTSSRTSGWTKPATGKERASRPRIQARTSTTKLAAKNAHSTQAAQASDLITTASEMDAPSNA
ncbi:MAG TPA: hypothetical protein VHD87_16940 [Acidimicrobiales bacterium]|nr:hypothetical protein [Acidimicrobiales bacterium]